MNSIISAKVLSTIVGGSKLAGKDWIYNFRKLYNYIDEVENNKCISSLQKQYANILKSYSKEKNSEWICRIYFSAKMILHTTLQLLSLTFSEDKNVRLVSSYLKYYALLSSSRALIMTLSTIEWNDGKITEISHSKIIKITIDFVKNFDKELSKRLENVFKILKSHRELITYRAPTIGSNIISNHFQDNYLEDVGIEINEVIYLCTVLAEFAQLNSEIFEKSVLKHADDENFELLDVYINQLSIINVNDMNFFDKEDFYRLNYLKRKYPVPTNILHVMTEGLTEDFFGAWEADEYEDELFTTGSPSNWGIIFDIP
ncbi:hypothetical protein [Aliarcobacter lanthieri]|uniref:hypothetical protein n=1 Tax=Aliarcobacter lanthieri TaxID=1355374 RepID=UPI003AACA0B7